MTLKDALIQTKKNRSVISPNKGSVFRTIAPVADFSLIATGFCSLLFEVERDVYGENSLPLQILELHEDVEEY